MVKRINIRVGPARVTKKGEFKQSFSNLRYTYIARASMKQMQEQLLSILDQFEGASNAIMYDALLPTFEKALSYTPVDYGPLVESAYLEMAEFRGKPRVEMGFAKGGDPFYAVYVHEITDYNHAGITRAKFLESAMMEDLDDIYVRLGEAYKRFMGG